MQINFDAHANLMDENERQSEKHAEERSSTLCGITID
jgi:hypothetical protein